MEARQGVLRQAASQTLCPTTIILTCVYATVSGTPHVILCKVLRTCIESNFRTASGLKK